MTRAEETKLVKEALIKSGFPVLSVGHGRGTAWNWIIVRLEPLPGDRMDSLERYSPKAINEWQARRRHAVSIVKSLTGREGEDNDILVS